VAGPLVWNSLPDYLRDPAVSRHFLQAPKDVLVCSVLIYVQRIRGSTTMRYINLRFTYLLTDQLSGPDRVVGLLFPSVCPDKNC